MINRIRNTTNRFVTTVIVLALVTGCAITAQKQWSTSKGPSLPRDRVVAAVPNGVPNYWTEVKPVLEQRCVACHACYDAACQFKTTAIEGLDRGAHKSSVYTPSRIRAAAPKRLFEDAQTTEEWRKQGYFPVLSERANDPSITRQVDMIYRALELKENNPLPANTELLAPDTTIGLNRDHECPTQPEYAQFAAEHPQWGMPYALPGLNAAEQTTLKSWVKAGAPYTPRAPVAEKFNASIDQWEGFLNGDSRKEQLVSRYLYEHLFLSHLYFPDVSNSVFFKVIRSATPPEQNAQIISTRRPFVDPKVPRVYYRIVPDLETTVDKTHNPYRLDGARLARYQELFFNPEYEVTTLPGYTFPDTANPFVTFDQLPMNGRYKFMLDDAQSSIMNFIKGSVCRGQVAVNVVRDHFWVFFLDPDSPVSQTATKLVPTAKYELAVANASGDTSFMPIAHWRHYAKLEEERRKGRDQFMLQYFGRHPLDLELVWDGDGKNPNAALTVFRHNDSATVEQGTLGSNPQTAWFIDYTLLERIHYLLVAGYDVYGTLGHQLISRLHMDYLRMEGETNFLNFLPPVAREATRNNWYRKAPEETLKQMSNPIFDSLIASDIDYQTEDQLTELMNMMKDRVAPAQTPDRSLGNIASTPTRDAMQRLSKMQGSGTSLLPELSIIRVAGEKDEYLTLTRNNAHINMTSIFNESKRRIPAENTVSVIYGVMGSYPNAFFNVPQDRVNQFVEKVLSLTSEEDYHALMTEFGIRRTNPEFWKFSDIVHTAMRERDPVTYGVLDYNRLENR